MATKGYWENPAKKSCFVQCSACFRCNRRGDFAKCGGCSGRPDKEGIRDPHPDDICFCSQGVLRWVTKEGRVIVARYPGNPFQGTIQQAQESQDERDYEAYKRQTREELDDPHWDPVQIR